MYTNATLVSAFRTACILLSSAVITAGAVSLVVWIFHLLQAEGSASVPTPDAALAFLVLGIAVRSSAVSPPHLRSEAAFYAVVAALVGVAAMIAQALHYTASGTIPVFMLPYSAAEFILLGIAVFFLQMHLRPARVMGEVFAIAATAGAFAACIAALYATVALSTPAHMMPIRISTALILLVLSVSVFLSQPQLTLWGLLVSRLPGGKMTRSLVVALTITISVLALLLVIGHRFHLFHYTVAFASLVVVSLVLPLVAVLSSSRKLDSIESERRRLDAELRRRDLEHKITLDHTFEAAISTDRNGTIEEWNQRTQNLLGYTDEEAVGQNVCDLVVPPERREHCKQLLQSYSPDSSDEQFRRLIDVDLVHKDGTLIPVELSVSPIPIGDSVTFWLVARDVSEQKRLSSELARAHDQAMESSQLKSEFVANISHEIRTPLNAIVGMTEILVQRVLPEELKDFITTIHESADSLLDIVNDILDYSKIEAGKMTIETSEIDIVSMVECAAELVADRAREKGLSLSSYVSPDVPTVLRGDPGRIRQVLLNLLTNAIKFTETGEVMISASLAQFEEQYAHIRFTVHDTGIGIPQAGLLRIFDPFIQADGSVTRKHGGTGLGLSISKRLVQLMGGQIGVESVEAEGSTFWFVIPLEKPAKRASITPTRQVFQDVKLLIVDGPTESGHIVRKYASSWGIRCDVAATGEDAVHMLRQDSAAGVPYDLAIIDFQLTYSDALALAQSISRYSDLSYTKLILMSCFDDVRLAHDALHSGFSAVLTKPVRQARLYECFVNLLTQTEPVGETLFADGAAELTGVPTITGAAPLIGHTDGSGGRKPADVETLNTGGLQPRDLEPSSGAQAASLHSGTGGLQPASHRLPPTFQRKGIEVPLILVVEDNPVNQKVVMLQLSELGYRAHAVANGRECLEALTRTHYAVILMDCQMPEMDGFAATSAIREKETLTGEHIPIVALTAHAMIEDKYKCLNAGMDDYISKPVKPKALKEILDRYLSQTEIAPPPGAAEPPDKSIPLASAKPPIDMVSLRQTFGTESATELVSTFLGSTKFVMDRITHGITTRNTAEIEEAARELFCSSASMTASELSDISRDLEKASVDKNWNAIDGNCRALRTAFDRLTQFVANGTGGL